MILFVPTKEIQMRYAMQLIVAKTSNSVGFGDYPEGLQPDFLVTESISTYGVLGIHQSLY
jgi:hypothetical protein